MILKATKNRLARLEVGDRVRAKPLCRWPTHWAWRKVTAIDLHFGTGAFPRVGINYNSTNRFWLRPDEISHVEFMGGG